MFRHLGFYGFLLSLFVAYNLVAQDVDRRGLFEVNGTRLYYEVSGSGPSVVLIHGGWLNSSQWDEQYNLLRRNYRVLRYDMRGYGRSGLGQPDSAYSNYDDLAALLGHVGMRRVHLIGVSAGAQTAIDFALNYPDAVASLVLGASPLSGFEIGKNFTDGVAGIVAAGIADDLQLLHDRIWTFAPFKVATHMPRVSDRLNDMIIRQHLWASQRPGAPRPRRPATPPASRISGIKAPTLILVGDGEMPELRAEADFLYKNIQGATLSVIKGSGHFPNLEQPRRFNELVVAWLRQRARSF